MGKFAVGVNMKFSLDKFPVMKILIERTRFSILIGMHPDISSPSFYSRIMRIDLKKYSNFNIKKLFFLDEFNIFKTSPTLNQK